MSLKTNTNKLFPVRCRVCGRALEHPDSVAKGIGPKCEHKLKAVGGSVNQKVLKEIIQKNDLRIYLKYGSPDKR